MKLIGETKGIERLREIQSDFAAKIRREYEFRAKPCSLCESPGACCRDEHFVNVRITRLEAAAIDQRLSDLGEPKRAEVLGRVRSAIEKYGLENADEDDSAKTYACPLFEPAAGCLVHGSAKPLPCIAHACYEAKADVPPDNLIEEPESAVEKLNRRVYGVNAALLPLPVAIEQRCGGR